VSLIGKWTVDVAIAVSQPADCQVEIDAGQAAGALRQAEALFGKKSFSLCFGNITGNATEAFPYQFFLTARFYLGVIRFTLKTVKITSYAVARTRRFGGKLSKMIFGAASTLWKPPKPLYRVSYVNIARTISESYRGIS